MRRQGPTLARTRYQGNHLDHVFKHAPNSREMMSQGRMTQVLWIRGLHLSAHRFVGNSVLRGSAVAPSLKVEQEVKMKRLPNHRNITTCHRRKSLLLPRGTVPCYPVSVLPRSLILQQEGKYPILSHCPLIEVVAILGTMTAAHRNRRHRPSTPLDQQHPCEQRDPRLKAALSLVP